MSNLVYLYNCQGWWNQAERLGKETMTARKKVLGVEHPDTLLSIGNLAHTYNNQGRYREAEELLVQVMNIRIKVLGKDHPHTLRGISNLGVSYHNQGRWDEAEAMQSHVVAARKVLLGPEHFSTLTSMAHLSLTYHSQGRQPEAETLGLQVMELRKKVLGPEHHHTMSPIQRSQIIRAPSEEPVTGIKSVFLAGTTAAVENNGDWRENLSALLSNYPVTIFNPNRPDWDSTWREDINFGPYREQVLWELDKKVAADLVVVYLHPATLAPISLVF
ncbi:Zn(2)-C6 fungal-type DNA-binding domain protein [Metarhizium robertsii ARSEF 23]|nr:Zn(2)-C6 fungal-type DNA-binding domain protein [Metarhizium robertsii ARSEF 23]KHO10796.1 Zn(2)-C6 fungal-type DNA-binding domain protein [Metarhizium robertsii ARSEF 23]